MTAGAGWVLRDMRHIGDAETLVPFHSAVDDIDCVAPQDKIDEPGRRTLPAIDLVLAEVIDEVVLLQGRKGDKPFAAAGRARLVDAANGSPIKGCKRRFDVNDACFEERLAGRNRDLLVDKMRDASLARPWHQCLTYRFEGLGLLAIEQSKRHRACARLAPRHQNVDATYSEDEHAHARAFEKDAPLHGVHKFLPGRDDASSALSAASGNWVSRHNAKNCGPNSLGSALRALSHTYLANTGNTGNFSTSRASCWMMTVALRFAAIFFNRSIDATV